MLDLTLRDIGITTSWTFGWIYFFCWSLSFYPQIYMNCKRKSVQGLAIDYSIMNIIGYICMSTYQGAFLYSPTIRSQYAARHPSAPDPTMRLNDFVFAVHSLLLTMVMYSQFWPDIWGFSVSRFQRVSAPVAGIFWGCVLAISALTMLVVTGGSNDASDTSAWAWIDVMYGASYVKVLVTFVKYVPQAWVNYKRQSTAGWSIETILLDTAGGVLSIMQLIIDSMLIGDWSGITGNPAKLLLGQISLFFDIIFIVQHYVLYAGHNEESKVRDAIEEPLLNEDRSPNVV